MADLWSTGEATDSDLRDNRVRLRDRRKKRVEKNQLLMTETFSKTTETNTTNNGQHMPNTIKKNDGKQCNVVVEDMKTSGLEQCKNSNGDSNDGMIVTDNGTDDDLIICKNQTDILANVSSTPTDSKFLCADVSTSSVCPNDEISDCNNVALNNELSEKSSCNDIAVLLKFSTSEHKSHTMEDGSTKEVVIKNSASTTIVNASAQSSCRQEAYQEKQKSGNEVLIKLSNSLKRQIRTAEDTLIGPCGKKRCADRYDSSESSDSGVVVSCGEYSSSGTSDITEPGSPCSTSSDEGLAVRGKVNPSRLSSTNPEPLKSYEMNESRTKWPWICPTSSSAHSVHKHSTLELKSDVLSKSSISDLTSKNNIAAKGSHHQNQECQGKITEYFKTQIKPHGYKTKKNLADMAVLVNKNSLEFRRPLTVQRSVETFTKQLSLVESDVAPNDWNVKTSTSSALIKKLSTVTPRVNVTKLDKMIVARSLPSLLISNNAFANTAAKAFLKPMTEVHSKINGESLSLISSNSISMSTPTDFDNVNKNKNFANSSLNSNHTNNVKTCISNNNDCPISRLSSNLTKSQERNDALVPLVKDEEDEEEDDEDDSLRSDESKQSDSPILSAPTTIRFPASINTKRSVQNTDNGLCRWEKCNSSFECSSGLLEHLQLAHINTQTGGDNFVCNWLGCKVQGRTSCSRRWLERHVLSHGGNKPFRCIVDGCGDRFSSQTALERHVNSHFNQPETSSSSTKRNCENSAKLVRRNGKKLRYRRQPWSARLFDYFDTGVMEGLQHRLLELAKSRTNGLLADTPGNSMVLTSQVLGKRVEMDGKIRVLIRWHPQNIAPDEWVLESEVKGMKHVEIRKAATTSVDEISLLLYPAMQSGTPPLTRIKQRRKPIKCS